MRPPLFTLIAVTRVLANHFGGLRLKSAIAVAQADKGAPACGDKEVYFAIAVKIRGIDGRGIFHIGRLVGDGIAEPSISIPREKVNVS
jgi:hypothetical protein